MALTAPQVMSEQSTKLADELAIKCAITIVGKEPPRGISKEVWESALLKDACRIKQSIPLEQYEELREVFPKLAGYVSHLQECDSNVSSVYAQDPISSSCSCGLREAMIEFQQSHASLKLAISKGQQ